MMDQSRTAPGPVKLSAACVVTALGLLGSPALAQQHESEPNDTPLTAEEAEALGSDAYIWSRISASMTPGDVDWYRLGGGFPNGRRVYVTTLTSASATSSNTRISVFAGDATTLLEADEDNGTFGALSASIAGRLFPNTGDCFIKVEAGSPTLQVVPYELYLYAATNPPTAEIEPNGGIADAQLFPTGSWIMGNTITAADVDVYKINVAEPGGTVAAWLDLDPERNVTTWNGQLGILNSPDTFLVNDGGNTPGSPFLPNSEANFMTFMEPGTYYVTVQSAPPAGGIGTYGLAIAVLPFIESTEGSLYQWQGGSQPIPALGTSANNIFVPDSSLAGAPPQVVGKITVAIDLTHPNMPDLDVRLIAPSGKSVALFTDIGLAGQNVMDFVLDDDAAIPCGLYLVNRGMRYQLEGGNRLEWFAGEPAAGQWTLFINDDDIGNGGTLNSLSITIYEPQPPPPDCAATIAAAGGAEFTIFSTDFESGAAGFTHSGLQDEWQLGEPTFAPVTGCNSGVNCWKTDLDNTYNPNSNQELVSPAIDLAGVSAPIVAHWAQKYQMHFANTDRAYAEVRRVGVPASARRLWTWGGPPMTETVGNPPDLINEHAGWQMQHADISDFAGEVIELRFHLDSDNAITNLAGLAIDDVSITACAAPCPGDVNGSGAVNVTDLLALIAVWGPAGGNGPADLDNNGTVNVTDLLALIANWGPC